MKTLCILTLALAQPLCAIVTYSEPTDGELSNDNLDPTDLGAFNIGTSTVSGTVVDARAAVDPNVDVFTFQIAAGNFLSPITLTNFVSGDNVGFLGFNNGATFPFDTAGLDNSPDQSLFDGGLLFGEDINVNLIPDLADGSIGAGFSDPLGAGDYTIFLQQLGETSIDYTLSFDVIPEPSSILLLGMGSFAFLRRKR